MTYIDDREIWERDDRYIGEISIGARERGDRTREMRYIERTERGEREIIERDDRDGRERY